MYCTEDGKITNADDPKRAIWYGSCGYWTDDWDKLKKVGSGIPCCPICSCVGYQTTYLLWQTSIDKHKEKYKGYNKFIEGLKERCFHPSAFNNEYSKWLSREHPPKTVNHLNSSLCDTVDKISSIESLIDEPHEPIDGCD